MLKVLIVDDEHIVREGLKSIISWENYGFEICGEGIDGKDALNKIYELNPDLVLIDIKMPGMYGIDVIKQVREMKYKGNFIILTGYSDFEYAKSAIKLGVDSYLLKPIDEDELIEAVKRVYEKIERENDIRRHITNSKKHIKDTALRSLIEGIQDLMTLQSNFDLCNIKMDYSSFYVAIVDNNLESNREAFYLDLLNEVENIVGSLEYIDMINIEHKPVLIIKGKSSKEVLDILTNLRKKLYLRLKFDVIIALGRKVDKADGIHVSYKDARSLLDKRFFFSSMEVIDFEEINRTVGENSVKEDLSKFAESIYTYVEVNDIEKIEEILGKLKAYFISLDYSPEKVKGICNNIFIELKDKIVLNYEKLKNPFSTKESIIKEVYEKNSLSELIEYMKNEFINVSNRICSYSSDNIMKRIVNFIHKNYYKDIKLETLADIFNYNSAYLGKMFKSYTGVNFNSYLDKVRIENAKELLAKNDLKVYQVSEKVGYKSIDYFYLKFKKYVGVSPKEFKRQPENKEVIAE